MFCCFDDFIMSVYLHDIPLDEAKKRFEQALVEAGLFGVLGIDEIPLDEICLGRVLAETIWAKISSPHYHASAMDGFAVDANQTRGALPARPLTLACPIQAAYLDTGDPLPAWANAVIPIEQVEALDENENPVPDPHHPAQIRIRATVIPWSHVRPMGEDIVATQLVLPAGHGALAVDVRIILEKDQKN